MAFAPAYVEVRARRGRHGNPDRLPRRKENAGAIGPGRRGRRLDRIQKDRAVEFVGLAPGVVDGEGGGNEE